MPMIKLTIDGKIVQAAQDAMILEAARLADIKIPTLCYLKDIQAISVCRICVVEVEGADTLLAACSTPVSWVPP